MQNSMAALNPFKKDSKKAAPKKENVAKKESAPVSAEVEKKKEEKKKRTFEGVGQYLVRPHITEKATDLAAKNQYVFVVTTKASKKEIGNSVERMYGVNVEGVRIVNVHPKKMRLGKTKGVKKGYKKAIVQVKQGQAIEILPT
mgnify:CR=1 FL=1